MILFTYMFFTISSSFIGIIVLGNLNNLFKRIAPIFEKEGFNFSRSETVSGDQVKISLQSVDISWGVEKREEQEENDD